MNQAKLLLGAELRLVQYALHQLAAAHDDSALFLCRRMEAESEAKDTHDDDNSDLKSPPRAARGRGGPHEVERLVHA